ncbi:hypothetical protein EVAR_12667_1 [Eumeta japonica]|uniref:Uncharacterized protein n=1 Tax=Eumeta variegata TaxID=151549 RepID=A0A4C1YZU8_EUMVA|nr:hypothetical protein EVAR_12667_1 [Eumeta japonica]
MEPALHGKADGIDAVEIQSLHHTCGVSQKDRCRNSDVRERCGLKKDIVIKVERDYYVKLKAVFGDAPRMPEIAVAACACDTQNAERGRSTATVSLEEAIS